MGVILLFISCSSNDDEIDCELFDPAFADLYIKLVDIQGNNLIENGTIDPDKISVRGDFPGASFRFVPADEYSKPDAYYRELDNTLKLFIPNKSRFQYTIHLNSTDAIQVNFSAELIKLPCGLFYFKPNKVLFNNKSINLREVPPLQFVAVLELK